MEAVAFLMFAAVVALLLAGFPVAFTLGGTALLFAAGGIVAGVFNDDLLAGLPNRLYGIMTNETLVAVPLFVFMGVTLERARISRTRSTPPGGASSRRSSGACAAGAEWTRRSGRRSWRTSRS